MHNSSMTLFRFAQFVLDLSRGSLVDVKGSEIKLRPKSFELLSYLLLHSGRLISREELIGVLWADVIVNDESLTQCISELRKALNDVGQQIIKTVPRRGYLFACEVRSGLAASDLDNMAGRNYCAPDNPMHEREYNMIVRSGAALLPTKRPSIAILPFLTLGGEPDQEFLSEGVFEEVVTALSRIRWLSLIAFDPGSNSYAKTVDIKEVGRKLGVHYLLNGSVRRLGNSARANFRIIEMASASYVWAESFNGDLCNTFEFPERIAGMATAVLESRMRSLEIERVRRRPMVSLDAYDLYLQALDHLYRFTEEDINDSNDLAKRALAIDPNYSPAMALASVCCFTRHAHGGKRVSEAEFNESIALALRAVRVGYDDPEALWLAAISISCLAGDHTFASGIANRAVMLNPNSAPAWSAYGFIELYQNKVPSAFSAFERAIKLDPLHPLAGYFCSGLAQCYLSLGQYQHALHWADKSLQIFPTYTPSRRTKIICCVQLGRLIEARGAANSLLERRPETNIRLWRTTVLRDLPLEIRAVHEDSLRIAGVPEG